MCLSCGCGHPKKPHHDARNIVLLDLEGAAKAAGIDVEQAAENILSTTEKALDHGMAKESDVACRLLKARDEQRYTLGLAYPANRPDVGKAQDGYRDFVGAEALERAAWSYLRKSVSIGLDHAEGTEGHGVVVESYIYRGPDWHIADVGGVDRLIKSGDWLVGVVWDKGAWADIKAGKRNGWSPQGSATRRVPTAEALAMLRSI